MNLKSEDKGKNRRDYLTQMKTDSAISSSGLFQNGVRELTPWLPEPGSDKDLSLEDFPDNNRWDIIFLRCFFLSH